MQYLQELNQASDPTLGNSAIVERLAQMRPFAREDHAAIMLALIRAYDEKVGRGGHALTAAVPAEVSRFAPYASASEQPHDAEAAITLWLTKVAGCINTVAQRGEGGRRQSLATPVPVSNDFFDSCRDGRAIAALLVRLVPRFVCCHG